MPEETIAILIVVGFASFLLLVHFWDRIFPDDERDAFKMKAAYIARRMSQGLSHDEAWDEGRLRESLANLRETVSDYVRENGPEKWEDFLREQIRLEVIVLSAPDPALGKRFVNWISSLQHDDILYPYEYSLVHPTIPAKPVSAEESKRIARKLKAAYTDL